MAIDKMQHELEADRAEVARLRNRVRVEAEDIEHAGVSDSHAKAYLLDRGWSLGHSFLGGGPNREPRNLVMLLCDKDPIGSLAQSDSDPSNPDTVAFLVRWHAKASGRDPWDVLDEMAATKPEG